MRSIETVETKEWAQCYTYSNLVVVFKEAGNLGYVEAVYNLFQHIKFSCLV